MLDPVDRHNLVELLRPPAGYRLDGVVGTTYSMDFVALTAVLLAFADAEADYYADGDEDVDDKAEDESAADAAPNGPVVRSRIRGDGSLASLQALLRLRGRVRVFANRGGISIPTRAFRPTIQGLYDRIVCEVNSSNAGGATEGGSPRAGGCFHPKVWVALYEPKKTVDGGRARPIARIICGSRNLSTGRCWEAFAAFEGQVGTGAAAAAPHASGLVREARRFLTALVGENHSTRAVATRLADALQRTAFNPSRPFNRRCEFNFQSSVGRSLSQLLPDRCARVLVVSPFVRSQFLWHVLRRAERLTLVTSQRELDAISDESLHRELGKHEVYVVQPSDDADGRSRLDLHAKIYVFEGKAGCRTVIGSANASGVAWGLAASRRNWEAIICFEPGMSVVQFRKSFLYDDAGNLRAWVQRYERLDQSETESERAERESDDLKQALAMVPLIANYDEQALRLRLVVTDVAQLRSVLHRWPEPWEVRVVPLALVEGELAAAARLLDGEGASFQPASLAEVGEFVVWEIGHPPTQLLRRFVVKAVLSGAGGDALLERREAEVLKRLMTKDRFRDLLMALLFDATVRPASEAAPVDVLGGGAVPTATPWSPLGEASLEDVLRACTEDPDRVDDVTRLVQAAAPAGLVDPTFHAFWSEFVGAFREAEARGERDGG